MQNNITYNKIIYFTNTSLTCNVIKKSFIEKGKLILILENSLKIITSKDIDTSGHNERIQKLESKC